MSNSTKSSSDIINVMAEHAGDNDVDVTRSESTFNPESVPYISTIDSSAMSNKFDSLTLGSDQMLNTMIKPVDLCVEATFSNDAHSKETTSACFLAQISIFRPSGCCPYRTQPLRGLVDMRSVDRGWKGIRVCICGDISGLQYIYIYIHDWSI